MMDKNIEESKQGQSLVLDYKPENTKNFLLKVMVVL